MKGLTQQFFGGLGIGLSLLDLFFFGDLVALVDGFLFHLASVGNLTWFPCTVVSDHTIDEDFLISF